MKQHITPEQFNELSFDNKAKLFKLLFPKVYSEPRSDGTVWEIYDINHKYLTIGQMIEFLDIHIIYLENEAGWWGIKTTENIMSIEPVSELCDALWEAVKEVLENE